MPRVQVFDPALCCPTGVCGTTVDPALLRFAGALAWLRRQGVLIERWSLAQYPQAFTETQAVQQLLMAHGESALPVTLVDGRVLASGSYPTKEALAAATGVALRASLPVVPGASADAGR